MIASIVVGMIVAAVYLQGAFYPGDAFGVAVLSVILATAALTRSKDRFGLAVTVTVGGLALWWLIRAVMERTPSAFFPLGAAVLGFLASFLVIRSVDLQKRAPVATAVTFIGAIAAGAGLAGVIERWSALAANTDGTWRVSTTLTYPAGAAALFIIALLVAMALESRPRLVRAAVCLCVAGIIGTQSHWDLLALACGALVVPIRRWIAALWPLALGTVAGLAVVAAGTGVWPGWASALAIVACVLASTLSTSHWRPLGHRVFATTGLVIVAGFMAVLSVHPPIGTTPTQTRGQSQTVAWAASASAWRSSVLTGVGQAPIYSTHSPVVDYPGLVPNSYLTIVTDGGLLGGLLLLAAGAAVAATMRRRDLLSTCAVAATVAFAVAGNVDFDWQLPALALVGGCVAGLASGSPDPKRRRAPAGVDHVRVPRFGVGTAWALMVTCVLTAQICVGFTQEASGASRPANVSPPSTPTPAAPARFILRGPDSTDPFMLKIDGLYYLYASQGTSSMNTPLRVGRLPGQWGKPIDVLPHLPSWAKAGATWAPDVQKVKGGWALYFTALLASANPSIHCIGSAFSQSPEGPFIPVWRPFICQLDHRGSIDPRTFVYTGSKLVMLWKSDDNANPSVPGPDQNGKTGIYAQDLSPDGRTLLGHPVRIFTPSQAWEGTIVEAPDMIEEWRTYWLFFSGNWYDSASYGIGVAACQSPFGPCQDPDPKPFLGSNLQGLGPGESSLFQSGPNIYLLYDPFRANDPGPVIARPVAMARLGFRSTGPYLAAW